jgi:hypothetical protein
MFDFVQDLRLFLLSKGFVPINDTYVTGNSYAYQEMTANRTITLTVNIGALEIIAEYPDFEYNKKNPYSKKNIRTKFQIPKDSSMHDLEEFIKKSFELGEHK